jgi:hypothetical protein
LFLSMMNSFLGVYGGLVEENRDPEKLGRVKVRVPAVYGTASEVPTDRLPWAWPRGLPFGNTHDSGGMSWLPAIGDTVWTMFLDGEPEKPLWEWGVAPKMTRKSAPPIKLHEYSDTQGGYPDRGILSRYGHSLEVKPDKVTLTTDEGQQLLLQTSQSDAGGAAKLQTPKGQSIKLSDMNMDVVIQALESLVASAKTVQVNAPTSTLIKTGRFTLMAGSTSLVVQEGRVIITTSSGASFIIDNDGNIALSSADKSLSIEDDRIQLGDGAGTGFVIEQGKISVNSPQFVLNTSTCAIGNSVGYPVLLLTPQMMAWLLGHTHTNGNNGSPTGPPIPMDVQFPLDSSSNTLHTS